MLKNFKNNNPNYNLKLIMIESTITASLMSVPFMSFFWCDELGLSHGEVGLTQAIFSIVMILLDYPMGIVADKFSRKWCNIIGDFGMMLGFIFYSKTNSFLTVVLCESFLGVCQSLSNGVDGALIRHYTSKIDQTGRLFKTKYAKLSFIQNFSSILILAIGIPLGAISYRTVILASGIPYLIGGILSIFINDDSEKMPAGNPVKDFVRITKKSVKNRKMRLGIIIRVISREATHVMMWLTTPIMIMAGVPANMVVIPWIINSIFATFGSWMGKKYVEKLPNWKIMTIFTIMVTISTLALSIKVSALTAPFFLLMGVTQGWTGATLKRLPEQYAEKDEQASVCSFASTLGRIFYAATGTLVNFMADRSYSLSAITTFIIFVPISIYLIFRLKKS